MKHIPHVVIAAPWEGEQVGVSIVQGRHLTKVLKMHRGDKISYTDGLGTVGVGTLTDQAIMRGDEKQVPRPSELTVAVAPPSNKDRQRFVVEKLSELGVRRLQWLRTQHGTNRPPKTAKAFAWVVAATEQSRGAYLMELDDGLVEIGDLEEPVVFCHPEGDPMVERPATLAIGPEGGFSEDELPKSAIQWSLGDTVLRVETAALVGSARILG